ncbi:MAG: hypothetical protein RIA69_19445 [Cyclobacteriaceae bacterium]
MAGTIGILMIGSRGISLLGNQRDKDISMPTEKKTDSILATIGGFCAKE